MEGQTILYGKPVAEAIRKQLKEKFAGRDLTLATFLVGDNKAAHVYKRSLLKTAESLGIHTRDVELPEQTSQEEAELRLRELSEDPAITGILPLMPVPKHIHKLDLIQQLDPEKDMDCVHPVNSGRLYLGITPWGPCTPRACMAILDHYGIPLEGQNVAMVGYGEVVGRPLTLMLMGRYATVTVCRSRTKNLPAITRQADVIISAVGKPGLITEDMIREGAVVIDVGINSVDGKLVGDVPEAAKQAKASAYTPVPGGVGVVSNLMVMETLTRSF